MNKKQITIMAILALVLAFMDISGLPAVLFINCRLSDVTPYIMSLLVNFLIINTYDRADFNSNRRFCRWTNDVAEYLEEMADTDPQAEIDTVEDLPNEIENENLLGERPKTSRPIFRSMYKIFVHRTY